MTVQRAWVWAVMLAVCYWGTLLVAPSLDADAATLAALITYPLAVALAAATAGRVRRVVLRLSYVSLGALPPVQWAAFGPDLLHSSLTFGADHASRADQAGAAVAVTFAIITVQAASMAVLTWIVYRLITPADRLSR